MELWQHLAAELMESPLGPECKSSRWFNFEVYGRWVSNRCWRLLLLLIHLGCMRKWRKLGHCPLFSVSTTSRDCGEPLDGIDGDPSTLVTTSPHILLSVFFLVLERVLKRGA